MRISDWSSDVCSSDLDSLILDSIVIAFQKSRSSCNFFATSMAKLLVIAFQKSRSSCNRQSHSHLPRSVIAFQKSRSSCNLIYIVGALLLVIAFQKSRSSCNCMRRRGIVADDKVWRSEEHTSELQSLMRISYAVFCLKKKNANHKIRA